MNTLSHNRLVDNLIEAYVDWREAADRVNDSYDSWARGTGGLTCFAFAVYLAALDEEEKSAEVYAGLVQRVGKLPWQKGPQTEPARSAGRLRLP